MKQPGKYPLAEVLGQVAEKKAPTLEGEVSSDVKEFLGKVSSCSRPPSSFKKQHTKTVVEISIAN